MPYIVIDFYLPCVVLNNYMHHLVTLIYDVLQNKTSIYHLYTIWSLISRLFHLSNIYKYTFRIVKNIFHIIFIKGDLIKKIQ